MIVCVHGSDTAMVSHKALYQHSFPEMLSAVGHEDVCKVHFIA